MCGDDAQLKVGREMIVLTTSNYDDGDGGHHSAHTDGAPSALSLHPLPSPRIEYDNEDPH